MAEQAALREIEFVRERADRETAEPDTARERDGALEDGIASVGTLGCDHGPNKSKTVRFCQRRMFANMILIGIMDTRGNHAAEAQGGDSGPPDRGGPERVR